MGTLLLILSLMSGLQEKTSIHYADNGKWYKITVPSETIGTPFDVVFSPRTNEIIVYTWSAESLKIVGFSSQGQLLYEQVLPKNVKSSSLLFGYHENPHFVAFDPNKNEWLLVRIAGRTSARVHVTQLGMRYRDFAHKLNPKLSDRVRGMLRKLNWIPSPRIWGHGDLTSEVDNFCVTARFTEDRVAWNRDMSYFCFGWYFADMKIDVAKRKPDGDYIITDLRQSIYDALNFEPTPTKSLTFRGLSIQGSQLAICVEPSGGKGRPSVLWLDLAEAHTPVIRGLAGLLVRDLEFF